MIYNNTVQNNKNKSDLVQLMVKALIEVSDFTNRILNIVKATHGLNDKGETIEFIVQQYAASEDIPGFKPELIKKLLATQQEKSILVDNVGEFLGLPSKHTTKSSKNTAKTRHKKPTSRHNTRQKNRTTTT